MIPTITKVDPIEWMDQQALQNGISIRVSSQISSYRQTDDGNQTNDDQLYFAGSHNAPTARYRK